MNAANFSTFSLGNGCWGLVRMHKHLYDFPKEWYQMVDYGVMGQLPRHKAEEAVDKPAYVTEVRHELTTGIIMGSMSPKVQQLGATEGTYKHKMIHVAHPLKKYLEECKESWDDYQKTWKENGATHDMCPTHTPLKWWKASSRTTAILWVSIVTHMVLETTST